MQDDLTFSDFLKDVTRKINYKNLSSGVISICNQIPSLRNLSNYSNLLLKYSLKTKTLLKETSDNQLAHEN